MTLVWLAATLAVILAGCVFGTWTVRVHTTWTVRVHTIMCGRLIQLHRERLAADIAGDGDDQRSRDAWAANRAVAYQHAMTLTLQRAEVEKVDALVAVLDRVQTLEVVA